MSFALSILCGQAPEIALGEMNATMNSIAEELLGRSGARLFELSARDARGASVDKITMAEGYYVIENVKAGEDALAFYGRDKYIHPDLIQFTVLEIRASLGPRLFFALALSLSAARLLGAASLEDDSGWLFGGQEVCKVSDIFSAARPGGQSVQDTMERFLLKLRCGEWGDTNSGVAEWGD